MQRSRLLGALRAVVFSFISMSSHAALTYVLGGQAVYDDVADLSWTTNANINGLMTWDAANAWAAGLDVDGVTGWRLPTALNSDGSGPCGPAYNCTGSEMGNLFYNVLGNITGSLSKTGPFSNVQSNLYWSSTEYAPNTGLAWDFYFGVGGQDLNFKSVNGYAWAVHDGDVGAAIVPVPAAQSAQLTYFAEDFTFLGGPGFERGMYNIDTTTGTYSLRTTVDRGCVQQNGYCTGFNMINGARFFSMDRRPSDGTVFAATFEPNDLYTVDIDSGAVNYIGSTLPTSVNSKQWQFTSLAFNPLTDELYGLSNDTLFLINQVDGTPTILGKLPTVNTGLAFSPQGELYGYDWSVSPNVHLSLYKVDLGTLTETLIGTTTGVNCSTVDATFTQGGSLYISGFCGDIYQTDLTTGTSILVVSGSQTGLVDGGMLALLPAAVPSPPVLEPFPWEIFMPAILHGAKARSLVP